MNRLYIAHLVILTLSIILFPQRVAGIGLEIAGGYWWQSPSGNIQSDAISSSDNLDLEQDLNYDDKYRPFGRIKADMPAYFPDLYLMATPMKFEESGSKNINFKFGDRIFSASIPFDSKLKMDHYDIALFYSLPFLNTATLKKLNAEIGIDARIINFEAEINQHLTGISESERLTIILPMVYVGIQLKPADFMNLEVEGRGIAYSSNHYYDLIGRLKIMPFGPFFVAGGYRHENVEIDRSDVEASIKFEGPFVEAGLHF